jgi:hypothetical protein
LTVTAGGHRDVGRKVREVGAGTGRADRSATLRSFFFEVDGRRRQRGELTMTRRAGLRLHGAAAAVLLFASCGAADEAATTAIAPTETQAAASAATTAPTQTPEPTLVCEKPPPTELALGSTVTSDIDDAFPIRCFWVEVPENLNSMTIELTDLTADLNLALVYGFLVNLQYNTGEFWQSTENGTADEAVVIKNPQPGPYYIKVGRAGSGESSPFTLTVRTEPAMTATTTGATLPSTETCAPPATEITLGAAATSEVIARDEPPLPRRYFCVQAAEGLSSMTIELTGLTGDLDLLVRLSTRPEVWVDRSRGSSERVVVIESPEPGPYYIEVAGAYPGASSAFTLNVRSP